jgi:hypothetical protein
MGDKGKTPRVRVLGWRVSVNLLLDDGDTLTPLPPRTNDFTEEQWEEFIAGAWREQLNQVKAQVLTGAHV